MARKTILCASSLFVLLFIRAGASKEVREAAQVVPGGVFRRKSLAFVSGIRHLSDLAIKLPPSLSELSLHGIARLVRAADPPHLYDVPPTYSSGDSKALLDQTARPKSSSSFFSVFTKKIDKKRWMLVGPYANGQPFNTGWDPSMGGIAGAKLTLNVKRKDFYDYSQTGGGGGTHYPFTSAEIRSKAYYGAGCYSVCMKPSRVSGVSSSFYIMSGEFDTPRDAGRSKNELHNEVDIEFVGKNTSRVQTNFFSRVKDPGANSASGHEVMHDLGFDAAHRYHSYSIKWTKDHIAFFVDNKMVRVVWNHEETLPSPSYSTMRVVANIWPVNKQAEEWAGKLPPKLTSAQAKYAWMSFTSGASCRIRPKC